MTSELTLQPIPFVDGLPDEGQFNLKWIVNGECLDGTENKRSSGGSLNRVPSQLQKNVNVLVENQNVTKDKVNVLVETVNTIEENLKVIADQDVIDLINKNHDDIELIQAKQIVMESDVAGLKQDTAKLIENVGVYDPTIDPVYRTVRGELEFQKTEMGNYPGFDKNGQTEVDAPGRGMKGIIIDTVDEVAGHRRRIIKLENDWNDSDVGQVVGEVQAIRAEIGPKSEAVQGKTIYARLKDLSNKSISQKSEIDEIKTAINFDGGDIADIVGNLENQQMITNLTIEAPNTGLRPRLEKVESQIGSSTTPGSILHNIANLDQSNRELTTIVGASNSEGLRYSVAHLNNVVGIVDAGQPLPTTSLLYKVDELTQNTMTNTQAINDLRSEVIPRLNGIDSELDVITNILAGDPASNDPLLQEGLSAAVKRMDGLLAKSVINPPDGTFNYVRRGNTWVQVPIAAGRYGLVGGTTIDIKADDTDVVIPMDQLVADSFNRGLSVNQGSLSIADKGAYKLEGKLVMDQAHNSEKYVVSIYINGTRQQAEWIAFNNLEGEVVSTATILLNIKETDLIELFVRTTSGALGPTKIKQLAITAQPL